MAVGRKEARPTSYGVGASHRYRPALPSHGSQGHLQISAGWADSGACSRALSGESGQRELSPLGETGAGCSLSRGCLTVPERDLSARLPAGPHERRLLGTPCVARGRALKGGCACVLRQAGLLCSLLCEGRAPGLRLSPHTLAQDRCKYVSPSKALCGAQSGQWEL